MRDSRYECTRIWSHNVSEDFILVTDDSQAVQPYKEWPHYTSCDPNPKPVMQEDVAGSVMFYTASPDSDSSVT